MYAFLGWLLVIIVIVMTAPFWLRGISRLTGWKGAANSRLIKILRAVHKPLGASAVVLVIVHGFLALGAFPAAYGNAGGPASYHHGSVWRHIPSVEEKEAVFTAQDCGVAACGLCACAFAVSLSHLFSAGRLIRKLVRLPFAVVHLVVGIAGVHRFDGGTAR